MTGRGDQAATRPAHLSHAPTGPGRLSPPHSVLVNSLAPRRTQRVPLQVEILIVGRDARVTDQHDISGGHETHPIKMNLTLD
jgi:hypothetical protein